MSKAIEFLESLGRSPAMARGSFVSYADAVAALDVDDRKRSALLARDARALSGLLGGRAMMAMNVATPDHGNEPLERPQREDEPQREEEPGKQDNPD